MKLIETNKDTITVLLDQKEYSSVTNFPKLIEVFHQSRNYDDKSFVFDFTNCNTFAGNLTALIGAYCYYLTEKGHKIKIKLDQKKRSSQELVQMGFLYKYITGDSFPIGFSGSSTPHIPYQEFNKDDDQTFNNYIETEFLNHTDLPQLKGKLYDDMSESLLEIFTNVYLHSHKPTPVFISGKSYPHRKKPRIYLTIVDLGIGFAENFTNKFHRKYNGKEALEKAIIQGETTKDYPGGLGYKTITNFVRANQGKLLVYSNDGYYSLIKGKEKVKSLKHPFGGTIVNLEVKIDYGVYCYSSH